MTQKLFFGWYTLYERLIRWSIHPKFRSWLLSIIGAHIDTGVRVYETQFSGFVNGFKNLHLHKNSIIGQGCFFDLTGKIVIGERTTISPSCLFITHQDPGSMVKNQLSDIYIRDIGKIIIGNDSWIGAGTTVINDVSIGSRVVIGAGSLVIRDIPAGTLAFGRPAKVVKTLPIQENSDSSRSLP